MVAQHAAVKPVKTLQLDEKSIADLVFIMENKGYESETGEYAGSLSEGYQWRLGTLHRWHRAHEVMLSTQLIEHMGFDNDLVVIHRTTDGKSWVGHIHTFVKK